ncbi:MYG1 exonuclease-like [Saccoglossus kowalevskii]|uniref:UPF0160 protein MYG1, mitochondrial-like n=1 Tax=Saccoglossus kowalevskii TaxID=10224 RepID=A0ABM0GYZ6_SACKO|nr:PREDICTED: UPF0160 protein MYG1, mitochondrial-like [Saccoglossus kowalevskii]
MRISYAVKAHMLQFSVLILRCFHHTTRFGRHSATNFGSRSLSIFRMSEDNHAINLKKVKVCKKIGTHNGTFHCDEVLACFLLKQLPEYEHAEIIRTRDSCKLDTCDIVVDVGGVFDASKHRYDHHQRSFEESMNSLTSEKPWTTKLSSAGLVYLHFGHSVIARTLQTLPDDKITKIIFDKVYESFIEEVDAIDNGISQWDEKPRYLLTTNLSCRVSNLNPWWNDTKVDVEERFEKAMSMVGAEFLDRVLYYHKCWWPARSLVEESIKKRFEVDDSGEIIIFQQGGCPWKDHLFDLEEEMKIERPIKYVLYTDQNDNWRVQCVPIRKTSFENRVSLLEEWRGLRDDELSKVSGIPGCIFVHASGFIGGNKNKDGVLEMARHTLKKLRPAET